MQCCNYTCDQPTWGKRIRCGTCRRTGLLECADCGVEVEYPRTTFCKDCQQNHRNEYMINYRGRVIGDCVMCFEPLEGRRSKVHPGDCRREYNRLYDTLYKQEMRKKIY